MQQQAEGAFLEVATSASGVEGCGKATENEIDCLLGALQNPSSVVREVALKVWSGKEFLVEGVVS